MTVAGSCVGQSSVSASGFQRRLAGPRWQRCGRCDVLAGWICSHRRIRTRGLMSKPRPLSIIDDASCRVRPSCLAAITPIWPSLVPTGCWRRRSFRQACCAQSSTTTLWRCFRGSRDDRVSPGCRRTGVVLSPRSLGGAFNAPALVGERTGAHLEMHRHRLHADAAFLVPRHAVAAPDRCVAGEIEPEDVLRADARELPTAGAPPARSPRGSPPRRSGPSR